MAQIATKLKNSNRKALKTLMTTKTEVLNCDKTSLLKLETTKNMLKKNSISEFKVFWYEKPDTSKTNEKYSGQHLVISHFFGNVSDEPREMREYRNSKKIL